MEERKPSPVELAAEVYQREPCARTFREDLEAHLINGYVHSTPEAFVMARPVNSKAPKSEILDTWRRFELEESDAWLIWLASGKLATLLNLFPYSLPLIGWEKRNKLRWRKFDLSLAKIAGVRTDSQ